jgi:pimeloyl-ACP methyl ester carboxylesterase
LIIAGAEDQVIPVTEAEKMAKVIPNSKLVVLKKTGHLSNLENNEEFNAAVTEFLASL